MLSEAFLAQLLSEECSLKHIHRDLLPCIKLRLSLHNIPSLPSIFIGGNANKPEFTTDQVSDATRASEGFLIFFFHFRVKWYVVTFFDVPLDIFKA